jgi:formiminoglutamase
MSSQLFPYLTHHASKSKDYWKEMADQRDHFKIKSKWKTINASELVGHTHGPIILTSPSDLGVIKNGGRSGTCFAPKAIINQMKNFHFLPQHKNASWSEIIDWQSSGSLQFKNPIIHLGGGHDTLYDLFSLILREQHDQSWLLINIDAHTDTRTDKMAHSGNPILRLAQEFSSQLKIWQLGIHELANSAETLKSVNPKQQYISYYAQCKNIELEFERIIQNGFILPSTKVFLSIDFDAFSTEYAQGVSAPNGRGLPWEFAYQFVRLLESKNHHLHACGIYEYNPLYDGLGAQGARAIAQLLLNLQLQAEL